MTNAFSFEACAETMKDNQLLIRPSPLGPFNFKCFCDNVLYIRSQLVALLSLLEGILSLQSLRSKSNYWFNKKGDFVFFIIPK